ncbi:EAL domain-containing protein [Candidatus Venteria ishoeyi]|uniref:GGDEF domain-containing response regulator n=1 Tax=Candidatus Venteria ishoeyi TaxID=1899563 RepID=UPI0025A5495C|nr:GGDEF domain-containing response regulator [Candidatus Venteria ishoeyi]MDM8544923.1 EAL domain-containing protein [Candidatus Venteria ishoeyi]
MNKPSSTPHSEPPVLQTTMLPHHSQESSLSSTMHAPSRILVAEDSPVLLAIMLNTLATAYGYQVETAENGQQALELFMLNPADMILMDADMPVLDGISACAQIRQLAEGRTVPIMIVTGYGERDWVDRAYQAGATDYVMKPINWDVLRNRIEYMLKVKQAEEALLAEKEKAQVTLASIGDGVITTDAWQRVEYLNPVASQLTGWSNKEAIGKNLSVVFNIIDEDSKETVYIPLPDELYLPKVQDKHPQIILCNEPQTKHFSVENTAAPIQDHKNRIIGMVLVFHDVTASRQMARDIEYQASHDPLTGLINRREFERRLNLMTQSVLEKETEHTLLYMDLDRFKVVNDTCTHAAGDELLRQVSKVIKKQIRYHDTAARLGGDEFGFLLEHCTLDNALPIAEKLCQAIQEIRFPWDRHVFTIGASIGAVSVNFQHANMNRLLNMADEACVTAKDQGRNQVYVYQEKTKTQPGSGQWFLRLQESLEQDNFCLFQQAILPLNKKDQGLHYEVLLRMQDEAGQLILPGSFFSAADRYNLMPKLDRWVIRYLCRWLHHHPEHLQKLNLVSINISDRSLSDEDFAEFVLEQLSRWNIPAQRLCFEFTELAASTHLLNTQHLLTELHQAGCYFALDNFGIGISSFNTLKNLPVDFIKIQGSLIQQVMDNPLNRSIVQSITHIAQILEMYTVAEFVENDPEMLKTLQEIGIDYVQGFALAEPEPLK